MPSKREKKQVLAKINKDTGGQTIHENIFKVASVEAMDKYLNLEDDNIST